MYVARAAVQVWDADALAYETFAPLCDPTAVGPVRSDTTTGRVVWPPPWWSLLIGARSFCLELNTTHGSPKKRGRWHVAAAAVTRTEKKICRAACANSVTFTPSKVMQTLPPGTPKPDTCSVNLLRYCALHDTHTHSLSARAARTYYRPSSSSASLLNTPRERAASSQRSRDCNTHQVAGSVWVSSMPRAATPLSRSEQKKSDAHVGRISFRFGPG